MAGFHLVVRGSCYLKLESAADPVELHQGDLVLVCHGSPHMISNPERARPVPFRQVLARHTDPDADLVFGGDGATTVLLCGGYHFAAGRSHPLRDILPPLIHVTTTAGHDLALVAGLLTREAASRGIGTATVTNRLAGRFPSVPGSPAGEPSASPSLQNVSEHCCHKPLDRCRARRTGLAV